MEMIFSGDIASVREGLAVASAALPDDGKPSHVRVRISRSDDGNLHVRGESGECEICYGERVQLFRGLGIIQERCGQRFSICERPRFATNGFMLDVSQNNAVLRPHYVKELMVRMALMGLNTFYLYMEDGFEVEGEPYFGYMRGRYTREELRGLDDFADMLGIRIIPCIQTLGHLEDVLKWPAYQGLREDDTTLLVGEERVYQMIERILRSVKSAFRSKRIHIGMDEAWRLGRGAYLDQHGYHPMHEIMLEHLHRVCAMCGELGIEPMVWSDMLINSAQGSGTGMGNYYNMERALMPEVSDAMPKDLLQVYWDYNHQSEEKYARMIERHRKLTERLVFAGGIWNWNGFAVDYDKTFATTQAALRACKVNGVQEVFATTWGDGGAESNIFATLLGMQLYAEHGYADDVDEETLARRFAACTGCRADDFRAITYIENMEYERPQEGYTYTSSSRILLWQDILTGLFDKHVEGNEYRAHYGRVKKRMAQAARRNPRYGYVFTLLELLADVLQHKADLGVRIKAAYDGNDRVTLAHIRADLLPDLKKRVQALWEYHRGLWFEQNKPFGWEVLEGRYGALVMRIDTAQNRLESYLEGNVECLEELEEERLVFDQSGRRLPMVQSYRTIASASKI